MKQYKRDMNFIKVLLCINFNAITYFFAKMLFYWYQSRASWSWVVVDCFLSSRQLYFKFIYAIDDIKTKDEKMFSRCRGGNLCGKLTRKRDIIWKLTILILKFNSSKVYANEPPSSRFRHHHHHHRYILKLCFPPQNTIDISIFL